MRRARSLMQDRNYPERAGWKEVVVVAGPGASIERASQDDKDRSQALSAYPADPTVAPPQDLKASVEWSAADPVVTRQSPPKIVPPPAPAPAPAPADSATSPVPPQASAAGTVVRGDFLSRLLHRGDIGLGLMLRWNGGGFRVGIHARAVARPWQDHRRGLPGGLARHFQTRHISGWHGYVYPYHQRFLTGTDHAVPIAIRSAGKDFPGIGRNLRDFHRLDRRHDAV